MLGTIYTVGRYGKYQDAKILIGTLPLINDGRMGICEYTETRLAAPIQIGSDQSAKSIASVADSMLDFR